MDAIDERNTTESTPSNGAFYGYLAQNPILNTMNSSSQNNAYVYAVLAFICTLCKAEADVQHLWYGRRAATRIRSELMAAIYDKALKRRDFSGIVSQTRKVDADDDDASQQTQQDASKGGLGSTSTPKNKMSKAEKKKQKKAQQAKQEKADANDEPKAGADVGKIVNLMAGDASSISMTFATLYCNYGGTCSSLSSMGGS